jgi:hypothetical protein
MFFTLKLCIVLIATTAATIQDDSPPLNEDRVVPDSYVYTVLPEDTHDAVVPESAESYQSLPKMIRDQPVQQLDQVKDGSPRESFTLKGGETYDMTATHTYFTEASPDIKGKKADLKGSTSETVKISFSIKPATPAGDFSIDITSASATKKASKLKASGKPGEETVSMKDALNCPFTFSHKGAETIVKTDATKGLTKCIEAKSHIVQLMGLAEDTAISDKQHQAAAKDSTFKPGTPHTVTDGFHFDDPVSDGHVKPQVLQTLSFIGGRHMPASRFIQYNRQTGTSTIHDIFPQISEGKFAKISKARDPLAFLQEMDGCKNGGKPTANANKGERKGDATDALSGYSQGSCRSVVDKAGLVSTKCVTSSHTAEQHVCQPGNVKPSTRGEEFGVPLQEVGITEEIVRKGKEEEFTPAPVDVFAQAGVDPSDIETSSHHDLLVKLQALREQPTITDQHGNPMAADTVVNQAFFVLQSKKLDATQGQSLRNLVGKAFRIRPDLAAGWANKIHSISNSLTPEAKQLAVLCLVGHVPEQHAALASLIKLGYRDAVIATHSIRKAQPSVIKALAQASRVGSVRSQCDARLALGKQMGDSIHSQLVSMQATWLLQQAQNNMESDVCSAHALANAGAGLSKHTDQLIETIGHVTPATRRTLVGALAHNPHPQATRHLLNLWKSYQGDGKSYQGDERMLQAISQALAERSGQDAEEAITELAQYRSRSGALHRHAEGSLYRDFTARARQFNSPASLKLLEALRVKAPPRVVTEDGEILTQEQAQAIPGIIWNALPDEARGVMREDVGESNNRGKLPAYMVKFTDFCVSNADGNCIRPLPTGHVSDEEQASTKAALKKNNNKKNYIGGAKPKNDAGCFHEEDEAGKDFHPFLGLFKGPLLDEAGPDPVGGLDSVESDCKKTASADGGTIARCTPINTDYDDTAPHWDTSADDWSFPVYRDDVGTLNENTHKWEGTHSDQTFWWKVYTYGRNKWNQGAGLAFHRARAGTPDPVSFGVQDIFNQCNFVPAKSSSNVDPNDTVTEKHCRIKTKLRTSTGKDIWLSATLVITDQHGVNKYVINSMLWSEKGKSLAPKEAFTTCRKIPYTDASCFLGKGVHMWTTSDDKEYIPTAAAAYAYAAYGTQSVVRSSGAKPSTKSLEAYGEAEARAFVQIGDNFEVDAFAAKVSASHTLSGDDSQPGQVIAFLKYFDLQQKKVVTLGSEHPLKSPFNGKAKACNGFQDLTTSGGHGNLNTWLPDNGSSLKMSYPIGDKLTLIDEAIPAITLFGAISINVRITATFSGKYSWDVNTAAAPAPANTVQALVGTIKPECTLNVVVGVEAMAGRDLKIAKADVTLGIYANVDLFNVKLPASMVLNLDRVGRMVGQYLTPGSHVDDTPQKLASDIKYQKYLGQTPTWMSPSSAFTKAHPGVTQFLKITPTLIGMGLGLDATFLAGKMEGGVKVECGILFGLKEWKKDWKVDLFKWPGIHVAEDPKGNSKPIELMSCDVCKSSYDTALHKGQSHSYGCPLYEWTYSGQGR